MLFGQMEGGLGGPRPGAAAVALGTLTAGFAAGAGPAAAAAAPLLAISAGTWLVGALAGALLTIVILLLIGRALDSGVRSLRLRSESERIESEVALARAEARFRSIFEGAPLGILVIDVDGTLRETNAAFDAMLGFERGELIGKTLAEITDEPDRERTIESFGALVRGEITSYEHEKRYKRRNGSTMWANVNVTWVAEDDAPFAIAIVDDVSDRIVIRDRLIHEATHDALTGLPNRGLFSAQLGDALRARLPGLAVAFVDLDHFKVVNDSLGHLAGDALLRAVAQRLRSIMRPGEIVARLGGDEFGVIFLDEDIEARVEWMHATVAEPAQIEGRRLYTTASVGVAVAHARYERPEDLLRDADIALYRSKAAGRATYTIFDEEMHERAVRRLQISSDVRDAINEPEQFRVAFQPLVRLADWRTIGYEALVRWKHPREGMIPPDLFIPAAEETGVIVRLGREVLFRALKRLAVEQRRDPDISMHVNVSVQEIMHGDLPEHVFAAISQAGITPGTLTLEITENTILDATTGASAVLERLRAGGVGVVVDDFGIGYSSLRYLRSFPITGLKIDKAFVSQGTDPGLAAEAIVKMVLDLGRSLDLHVVAEGIETPAQAEMLAQLGCKFGQGYIFSPPVLDDDRDVPLELPKELAIGRV
jgi:diguanylate cyclase (GGDEF)-like protein/PAS domain S-box-containing protein